AKLDPNAKTTFEGPSAGEGAVFAWAGNSQIGEGRMTLTQSRPAELIRIKLDFVQPMAGTSTAEFTFKPEGDRTAVTWAMFGQNNFVSRAICLFMNQDKMLGGYFEKGLENLKRVAEAAVRGQLRRLQSAKRDVWRRNERASGGLALKLYFHPLASFFHQAAH